MSSTFVNIPNKTWLNPVDTLADLPGVGNLGDERLVISEGKNYYWDGSTWQPIDTGGVASNSFVIIQTPSGTSPTATSPTDTLTFTSSDNSITITGNATTDTIDFKVASAGGVTSVSVVSANGLAGTVSNPTTTPAITLSTTITGILKGNGTAISAAVAGTDYQAPITPGTTAQYYRGDLTFQTLDADAVAETSTRTFFKTVAASGTIGGTINAPVNCLGAASLSSNTVINGDLYVAGNLTTGGFTLEVKGDVWISGTLTTTPASDIAVGAVLIRGDARIASVNLNPFASATTNVNAGSFTVGGNFYCFGSSGQIVGNPRLAGTGSTIDIGGDAFFSSVGSTTLITVAGANQTTVNGGAGGSILIGGGLFSEVSAPVVTAVGGNTSLNSGTGGAGGTIWINGDAVKGDYVVSGSITAVGGNGTGTTATGGVGGTVRIDGDCFVSVLTSGGTGTNVGANAGTIQILGNLYGNATAAGGASSAITATAAGNGGAITVLGAVQNTGAISSVGGACSNTSATCAGGAGGALTLGEVYTNSTISSAGGVGRTSANGGAGGAITARAILAATSLTASGGSSTSGTGGKGGAVTINGLCNTNVSTSGGAANSGTGGNGGNVNITGNGRSVICNGGNGSVRGGNGGSITITGDLLNSASSSGGTASGVAGVGGNGGTTSITATAFGTIQIQGGNATNATSGTGGVGGSCTCGNIFGNSLSILTYGGSGKTAGGNAGSITSGNTVASSIQSYGGDMTGAGADNGGDAGSITIYGDASISTITGYGGAVSGTGKGGAAPLCVFYGRLTSSSTIDLLSGAGGGSGFYGFTQQVDFLGGVKTTLLKVGVGATGADDGSNTPSNISMYNDNTLTDVTINSYALLALKDSGTLLTGKTAFTLYCSDNATSKSLTAANTKIFKSVGTNAIYQFTGTAI